MNSGFFLIDKDEGVSSASVVSKLKKKFNFKKVGHTGTLDPFATGLLVCPINSATRLSNFVLDTKKVYSGIILLGKKTDSDDITGNVMSESNDFKFTFNDILKIRDSFLGKITQVPPKLSAIKIDGKRAYDKFRKNEDFEMKERAVEVFSFEILHLNDNEISFRICCSKGTYIRSIARDFGEKLGVPSCLKTLRREKTSIFDVKDSKLISEVNLEDMILWYKIFDNDQKLLLTDDEINKLNVGNDVFLNNLSISDSYKKKFQENDILYYTSSLNEQKSGVLKKVNGIWTFAVNGI
ncbi:MAG: tRNA pseudouridine(55) synthase TruB [Bdellovibrionota bacterium]|nr:tRNA pseudouridine(55) synthase TruB [Pseudomonadota bacterium]MDY6090861.1 tRNA pseudouridine(55) synthase TruB [Bdellovibrionota bacterium]